MTTSTPATVLQAPPLAAACPPPLLDAIRFPNNTGYIGGRLCGFWPSVAPLGTSCCLPCPADQWFYGSTRDYAGPAIIGTISLILLALLLLSYAILPAALTARHHTTVGIAASLFLLSLAFALSEDPAQHRCVDAITPVDLYSSARCGAEGILLHFGALAAAICLLLRALHLHLRVVWGHHPRETFLLFSLSTSICIPVIFIGATIAVAGYADKAGRLCGVQREYSGVLLWGWLLGFGVVGLVLGLLTMSYAAFVAVRQGVRYRAAARELDARHTEGLWQAIQTATRRSFSGESGVTATEAGTGWVSVQKLLKSECRDVVLGFLLPLEIIVAAAILWTQDERVRKLEGDPKTRQLASCLVGNNGNWKACSKITDGVLQSEGTVIFGVALTALLGLQFALPTLLSKPVLTAWKHIFTHPVRALRDRDFPSTAPQKPGFAEPYSSPYHTSPFPKPLPAPSTELTSFDAATPPSGSLRIHPRPSLPSRLRSGPDERSTAPITLAPALAQPAIHPPPPAILKHAGPRDALTTSPLSRLLRSPDGAFPVRHGAEAEAEEDPVSPLEATSPVSPVVSDPPREAGGPPERAGGRPRPQSAHASALQSAAAAAADAQGSRAAWRRFSADQPVSPKSFPGGPEEGAAANPLRMNRVGGDAEDGGYFGGAGP